MNAPFPSLTHIGRLISAAHPMSFLHSRFASLPMEPSLQTIAVCSPCFAASLSQPLSLQTAQTRSERCCLHYLTGFRPTALLPFSGLFPRQSSAQPISVTQRQARSQSIRHVRLLPTTRLPSRRCSSRATRPSGSTVAVPSCIHAPLSLSASESLPWPVTRFGAAPLPTSPSSLIPSSAAAASVAARLPMLLDVLSPLGFFRSIARSNRIRLPSESLSHSASTLMPVPCLFDSTATPEPKAMEPTPVNVTIPASAGIAPFTSAAHLGR